MNEDTSNPTQCQEITEDVTPRASHSPDDDDLLSETEFQDYIEQFPFAAEPTYFTRPNRYYGPASTWRSWTAEDRAIADQHEAEQASNLSAHLYEAFAIKQVVRQQTGRRRSRSRNRPRHAVSHAEGNDNNQNESVVLPETWTTWPLPVETVPRRQLGNGVLQRPASALEDALIAVTLRHAKERWKRREEAPAVPVVKREKRDWRAEQDLTKQQLYEAGLLKEEPDASRPASEPESEVEVLTEDQETDYEADEPLPEGVQTFSSQAFLDNESTSDESDIDSVKSGADDDKPVFSADEDHARRLILPAARHIMAKLDDLLAALHKTRLAYAGHVVNSRASSRARSRSRSKTRPKRTETGNGEASESDQTTERRGRKRGRSLPSDEERSDNRGMSNMRSQSRDASKPRSRTRSGRHRTLAPRDWSDVLGLAAIVGWDTATLGRASERCAKLFEENMVFRTFHEADTEHEAQDEQHEPWFEDTVAYISDNNMEDVNADGEKAEVNRAYQPLSSEPLSNISTRLTDLVCPITACPKNEEGYVYGRRARLYKHISQAHPRFDLESFKKAASQNSRRGRYDRSKMRSRSRLDDDGDQAGSDRGGMD